MQDFQLLKDVRFLFQFSKGDAGNFQFSKGDAGNFQFSKDAAGNFQYKIIAVTGGTLASLISKNSLSEVAGHVKFHLNSPL